MRLIRRRRGRPAVLVVVAVLLALCAPVVLAAPVPAAAGVSRTAADDPPTPPPTPPPAPVDEPVFADPSSSKVTLSRGNSTVSLSRTGGLTRQMLNVSWTGMTPSEANIYFPVAVMQCRGYNPAREDCWMSDFIGNFPGVYRGSSYLPVETSKWVAFPGSEFGSLYSLPFKKADGTYHIGPNPDLPGGWLGAGLATVLDTSSVDDYTPGTGNQRTGFTRPDGTGEVQTWANTRAENPSLGCDDKTPCSIVVVPITQHPCREGLGELELLFCQSDADFKQDATLAYWPLLANWYQRYVFKLSFAPAASTCLGRDDSARFLGSELVGEAMRRWVPARCPRTSPSALDFTRGWEPDSRRQFAQTDPIAPSGYEADAVMVSEPTPADESVVAKRKPAYAPVAVSGFAIGYNWERAEAFGGGPVPEIKLNARLVAKLLTQSYPGKYRVGNDFPVNPNAGTNPPNLVVDPEFQQLNPDAKNWVGLNDAVGTQMAVPVFKSDVLLALTRWIWSDPEARAFVQGKADPWGTTVNKTYKGWPMPRDDYQLNDGWLLPKDQNEWSNFSPQALGAQSSNSWVQGADVLMTAWPLSQSPVPPLQAGLPTVPKRIDAQVPGQRSVLALTTTSELAKSGMPAVKLKNSQGEYVGPDTDSMTYALDNATVDSASGIWRVNQEMMDKRGYPGTMVTYAQVPTSTLKPAQAGRYAESLRWIATEGQLYGQEAGQLPEGYLSLTDPMRDQAVKVAAAVENQTGAPPIPPTNEDPLPENADPTPDQPSDEPTTGQNGGGGQNGDGNGKGTGDGKTQDQDKPGTSPTTPVPPPSVTPSKGTVQANGELKPVVAQTQGDSLGWLAWGIPALLAAGLAAGVASPGIRLIAQPGHPVRRGFAAGGSYVAGLVRRRRRHG